MATWVPKSARWSASARHTDPITGKPQRKYFYDLTAEGADAKAGAFKATPASQRPSEKAPRTVRELFIRWLTEKSPKADRSTPTWAFTLRPVQLAQWYDYESTVRVHILPTLGSVRLADLDNNTLRRFFAQVATRDSNRKGAGVLSISSQRKIHSRLTSACQYAALRGWKIGNPMLGIDTPDELPGTDGRAAELTPLEKALKVDEMWAFEAWIAGQYPTHLAYKLRWGIAFELGLRQAECLGLTWDVIDLKSRTITVRQQLRATRHEHGCTGERPDRQTTACTAAARRESMDSQLKAISAYRCPDRISGEHSIVATTKSKRVRYVKFSEAMATELAALHAEQHPTSEVDVPRSEVRRLAKLRAQATYPAAEADLVIRAVRGGYISKAVDNDMWHRACEGAHVSSIGRDVHAARHTAATNMVAAGVPLTTVMTIFGHSAIAVTQRYVTTTSVAQDSALDAVAEYLARRP